MESKTTDGGFNLRLCSTDTRDDVKSFAIETASGALTSKIKGELKRFNDVATVVSKALAEKFGGSWHVIVGKSFGSFITHETSCMVYFFLGQVGFLAFKHG